MENDVRTVCQAARAAARILSFATTAKKDDALARMAKGVRDRRASILEANARDVEAARQRGTTAAMIDRLALDDKRIEAIARGIDEIRALPDPVGTEIARTSRPNGLRVRRVRTPIGVIAMIYEARPNVTAEASALALKAGNAIVLRGGSEAHLSNGAFAAVLREAIESAGLPPSAVAVLTSTSRDAVKELLHQTEFVDLAIPRGGEALIRMVTEEARVPVVQHYKGVCHLFVDRGADVAVATRLVVDGKMSRPAVCNALECLLVDSEGAATALPALVAPLLEGGCELRVDARARAILGDHPHVKDATDDDYGREFGDKILAVRVVDGIDAALAHVARYGSGHTEAICTRDDARAERFRTEVDAACVAVNASTRFHDGGELGLGAEIGIATSRLHWRGPMGLESLTTMKWIVDGEGQTRH